MSRFTRPPFFVLGSVRSGTTMLRHILERHPALICPEETHLFRWPYPFGTPDFRNVVANNRTLRRHREIDGISEETFAEMLAASSTRRALIGRYMEAYAERRKPEATRWFEKSPQNVYGIQLIRGLFPEARFVHIVRHPLEVVSSLKLGKVMKVPSVAGAANYWLEAVSAIRAFTESHDGKVWQARYEDFTNQPRRHLRDLFAFLDQPLDEAVTENLALSAASHCGENVLTADEIATTWRICGDLAAVFGYACWPCRKDADAPAEKAGAGQASGGNPGKARAPGTKETEAEPAASTS